MKYVKFSGATPYLGTDFEDYLAFDDDVPEQELDKILKEYAIENAQIYIRFFEEILDEPTMEEYNNAHQDYLSNCIDLSSWKFISELEFDVALEEMNA